jgi:DNA polymerase-3 subunit delta
MTFAEFQVALKDDSVPPVLVLHGEEPFLARLGVDLLKKHVLAPGSEAFDFVSLAGREATADTVAAHAATAPMLSPRRLTVVYEFERMNPSERSKLLDYAADPVENSCLALVSFERLSGKNKFERTILSTAAVVECARPAPEILGQLVAKMAKERGKTLEQDALEALVDWTEGSLNRIANELDKLACFLEERTSITLDDVEQAVGARASTLRDLAVAIASREAGDALALLEELVDGGMEPAQLVSQLHGLWVSLWIARGGGRGGGGYGGWRQGGLLSGVPDVRELARVRSSREYAAGVERFYRADMDIRRGMPPVPTVSLLVYDLVRGAGNAASGT